MPLASRLLRLLDQKVGRCPKCMKTAFRFAAGSTALALVAALAGAPPVLLWAALALALLLGLNWLTHIVRYAARMTRAKYRTEQSLRQLAAPSESAPWPSRRQMLVSFSKGLAFAAMATAVSYKFAMAQACNCGDEGCDCPPDFPQCVFNPARQESICCGFDAIGCGSPTLTWCCPSNTSCSGIDDQCYGG
jgi:hypothetical protein